MTDVTHLAPPEDRELVQMLPAEAYTSDAVQDWERRRLYAGAWTCLGRVADLLPADDRLTQRAVMVGDVSCLLARDGEFASYLRSKGGELEKVRAPDGVHLERAGGDIIAKDVVRQLRPVYDVWSWKKQ